MSGSIVNELTVRCRRHTRLDQMGWKRKGSSSFALAVPWDQKADSADEQGTGSKLIGVADIVVIIKWHKDVTVDCRTQVEANFDKAYCPSCRHSQVTKWSGEWLLPSIKAINLKLLHFQSLLATARDSGSCATSRWFDLDFAQH